MWDMQLEPCAFRKGASGPGGAGASSALMASCHPQQVCGKASASHLSPQGYLLSWEATVLGSGLTGFWVGWWLGGSSMMDTVKKMTVSNKAFP